MSIIKKGKTKELIESLKFIPRTYTIELTGFGGEVVVGTVEKNTYEYFANNLVDVKEIGDFSQFNTLPDDYRPLSDGSWNECDDLCHEFGVEFSDLGLATVYDESGIEVWSSILSPDILKKKRCTADLHRSFTTQTQPHGTPIFVGKSFEKGIFFSGEIKLTDPFNPKKLVFGYVTVNGWAVGYGVEYDEEYIENDYVDTEIRGHNFDLFVVDKEKNSLEETVGEIPTAPTYIPAEFEMGPKNSGKVNPVYPGWYLCYYGITSIATQKGMVYWTGNKWVMHGRTRLVEVITIDFWQGLTWDTSDLSNRPSPINREE